MIVVEIHDQDVSLFLNIFTHFYQNKIKKKPADVDNSIRLSLKKRK